MDQKIENLLNISLEATEREREKSPDLEVGYDNRNDTWQIIVKHSGDLAYLIEKFP